MARTEVAVDGSHFGVVGKIGSGTLVAFAVVEIALGIAVGISVEITPFAGEVTLTPIAEASLFAHTALLLVRFHDAAFPAEVFQTAFKSDVFAQFAIQGTIVERYLEGRTQAHGIEQFFTRGDDPGIVALKLLLKGFAEEAVDLTEVFGAQTLAVRWVSDHNGRLFGLDKIANVALLHRDEVAHAGSFGVGLRCLNSGKVEVVAVNVVGKFALLAVVVEDGAQEFGIEVFPVLKTKLFAEDTGEDVARHQSGFDKQCAAAAERIDEIAIKLPAAHLDQRCSQNLVDGGFDGGGAVAAKVQALSAGVEREGAVVLGNVDVEAQVGVGDGDVGTLLLRLHEVVDDGVLDLVGDKL